jgi:hypothetical protein
MNTFNESTPFIPASPERFEKRFERRGPGFSKIDSIDKPEDVMAYDGDKVYDGRPTSGLFLSSIPVGGSP